MDLKARVRTFKAGSFKHLKTDKGRKTTETITLDVSKFTAGTHYPNGFIPAGVFLGKVTATGKYGPYDDTLTNGQEVCVGMTADRYRIDPLDAPTLIVGALQWEGHVIEANLPITGAAGAIDAAGKTDLGSKFRFV